jgi:hypothetical protein
MKIEMHCLSGIVILFSASVPGVGARLSRPDGVLHGTLGTAAPSAEDEPTQLVLARPASGDPPLAAYQLGGQPSAGEHYVLRFPYVLEADGKTPAVGSAKTGQAVKIYVKRGDGPEVFVTSARVPASGDVVRLDLDVSADALAGRASPGASGGLCGSGAGLCGATGMICLALTMGELVRLKVRRRRRRG